MVYHRDLRGKVKTLTIQRSSTGKWYASFSIVNTSGFIAVEDLMVSQMMHSHCLARRIANASWSAFFAHLSCKAEEEGRAENASS